MTDTRFSFICAAVLLVACAVQLLGKQRKRRRLTALVCGICAVSVAATAVYRFLVFAPVRQIGGQTAAVSGVICDEPEESNGRYYYVIETDSLIATGSLRDFGGAKLRLSSQTPMDAGKYDSISIEKAYVYAPQGGLGYSSQSYYESRGIALTGTFSAFAATVKSGVPPWYAFADLLREKISDALHMLLPTEESGLACGVLLGDQSDLSPELIDSFRACGISHLLVVSGLHISFLIMGLHQLLHGLLHKKRLAAGICLPVLLLFMAIVGFTPSVLRSGVMMTLYLLAILLLRSADSRTSLAIAVLLICLANPCAAGDVGLQLSFLATLGIQCCSGRWCRKIFHHLPRRRTGGGRRLIPAVCTTVSASLFTLPVTLVAFGTVSLIAPVVNLFAELPAQLLLQLSLITAAAQLCGFSFLARPLALLTGLLAKGLGAIAAFFAELAPSVPVSSAGWMLLVAVGLILAALCLWFPKAKQLPLCSVLMVFVLLMGSVDAAQAFSKKPRITLLNCADGLAVVIHSENESLLLLADCGKSAISACSDAFAQQSPDLLLLPGEYHRAASLAAREALNGKEPQLSVIGYRRIPDELSFLRRANVLLSEDEEKFSTGEITVQQTKEASGIWYRVVINQTIILIPVGLCDAAELTPERRTADILVLGYSVKNLSKISCKTVLVSAGKDSVQMLCSAAEHTMAPIYSTAKNAALTLFFENQKMIYAWN